MFLEFGHFAWQWAKANFQAREWGRSLRSRRQLVAQGDAGASFALAKPSVGRKDGKAREAGGRHEDASVLHKSKGRVPFINAAIEERLHQYLGGAVRGMKGACIEMNGMPDHVHLLVRLRQDQHVAEFVRDLKSNSSGWIHDTKIEFDERYLLR